MPDLAAISADSATMRVDRYLRQQFPNLSLGLIQRALRQRQIRLNNKRIKGDVRIATGDIVYVPQFFLEDQAEKPEGEKLKIDPKLAKKLEGMTVAVTPDYIVLNKPQGLAVQGGTGTRWHLDRLLPTLATMHDDPADHLRIVHRLDKDTSGLMLVARGRKAAQVLAKYFERRQIKKYYLALCHGTPELESGRIEAPLGKCPDMRYRPDGERPKPAESDYAVFDRIPNVAASIMLAPISGRTHQLRAHLALIDCPILGDEFYGAEPSDYITASPLCLHATALRVPAIGNTPVQQYFQSPPNLLYSKAKEIGLSLPTANQLWTAWSNTEF